MRLKQVYTVLTLSSLLMLGGCSSYGFNSNIDGERINNYFGAANMDVYMRGDSPSRDFRVISIVTGDSCQRSRNDPPASDRDGRSAMRDDAQRFKADAIIEGQCYALPADNDNVCYSRVSCYGQAIQWRD